MKSIIFLDNDGVVCLSNNWGSRSKKIKNYINKFKDSSNIPSYIKMDDFDIKSVKLLNSILEETGADIVVSSDWKLYCTLDELKEMFTMYGVIKEPIDITPIIKLEFDKNYYTLEELAKYRIIEIKDWLKNNTEVTKWVAIDDLLLGGDDGLSNFVLTSKSSQGIKQSGIKEKIISFIK